LQRAVLRYIRTRRWFAGKARTVNTLTIRDTVPLSRDAGQLAIVDVEYTDSEPETYLLPLAVAQARRSDEGDSRTAALIARLRDGCLLYEPVADPAFSSALLEIIGRRRRLKGERGTLAGLTTREFRELHGAGTLEGQLLKTEQSNTAITYDQRLFLKLFRKLEPGINTDFEVLRFLNEETSFTNTPRVAGALEYESMTAGILQGYTANSGDAWKYTLDSISRFFDHILSDSHAAEQMKHGNADLIGGYLSDADLLGRRTAEMHLALASRDDIPAFAPEPFTPHYQRSIYQSMRTQAVQTLQLLRRRAKDIPEAQMVIAQEAELQERFRAVLDGRIGGQRIRTHGDYHLGQVLHTGNDFVIIDFEGEPLRPLSERRIKRSALRDVAGMLRSFHYAPYAVVFGQAPGVVIRAEDEPLLNAAATFWHHTVSTAFVTAYLTASTGAAHLPASRDELRVLLDAYTLEKAFYEIVYELNNRPEWLRIPIRGVLELLA
jgi:maltose alpha-D-glucosyltransferase/alpha-amylase